MALVEFGHMGNGSLDPSWRLICDEKITWVFADE
jgi:hypothetical protein